MTSWMMLAACRGMDPNLFHPMRGDDVRDAKKVCDGCPVRFECLEHAVENAERCGVWGGMSEKQRRPLRAYRRRTRHLRTTTRVVLPYGKHGTRGCYVAGCRCDPCTDAEATYHREREARKTA